MARYKLKWVSKPENKFIFEYERGYFEFMKGWTLISLDNLKVDVKGEAGEQLNNVGKNLDYVGMRIAYEASFWAAFITCCVCCCIGIGASCCYCSVKNQIKMAHSNRVMNVQMGQMAMNMNMMNQQVQN